MSQYFNLQGIEGLSVSAVQPNMVAKLDEKLCNGCRLCLPTCNFNALLWIRSDNELMLDHWACNGCGTCISSCLTEALSLQPRKLV